MTSFERGVVEEVTETLSLLGGRPERWSAEQWLVGLVRLNLLIELTGASPSRAWWHFRHALGCSR